MIYIFPVIRCVPSKQRVIRLQSEWMTVSLHVNIIPKWPTDHFATRFSKIIRHIFFASCYIRQKRTSDTGCTNQIQNWWKRRESFLENNRLLSNKTKLAPIAYDWQFKKSCRYCIKVKLPMMFIVSIFPSTNQNIHPHFHHSITIP